MATYTIISMIEGEKRRSIVDANSKEEAIDNLEKHLERYNLYIEELISVRKERKYNEPVIHKNIGVKSLRHTHGTAETGKF